jgi:hypothetical protein
MRLRDGSVGSGGTALFEGFDYAVETGYFWPEHRARLLSLLAADCKAKDSTLTIQSPWSI